MISSKLSTEDQSTIETNEKEIEILIEEIDMFANNLKVLLKEIKSEMKKVNKENIMSLLRKRFPRENITTVI
jgi:hypothetical protein